MLIDFQLNYACTDSDEIEQFDTQMDCEDEIEQFEDCNTQIWTPGQYGADNKIDAGASYSAVSETNGEPISIDAVASNSAVKSVSPQYIIEHPPTVSPAQ